MKVETKDQISTDDLWVKKTSTFPLFSKQTENGFEEFLVSVDIWNEQGSYPFYHHRINGKNFTSSKNKDEVIGSYNGFRPEGWLPHVL